MASTSPSPPVAFQNQCSILHNNVLYVYQPNAFQILDLTLGANWTLADNGVSVTGAVCVKGGTDGNSNSPALYVVGGTTNSTTQNYTGIQRYSIQDNTWTTITPLSAVTANRLHHGATYLNASSSILVYGGSQNGNTGPSTETFLMLMYPPYRIQSYPSTAPPVVNPTVLQWSDSQAVMVGGSTTNTEVYTFHPDPGWVDLGLALPAALPDTSVAQSSLVILDDSSKVLLTYDMSQSPNTVRRTVLQNPAGLPAGYNQQIGSPTSSAVSSSTTAASRLFKRATYLSNYPAYNSSSASDTTRTNFALALGQNDFTAIVGGDANSTVEVFNMFGNSWQPLSDYVGSQQHVLVSTTSSISPSSTSSSPATHSVTASSSSTPVAVSESNSSNGLKILGGVLGGVCGLAAILIILLLYLRHVRRKRRSEESQHKKQYSEDKPSFEEPGLQPLSRQAQPMGRSPVSSTIMEDRDSVAMFGPRSEKTAETEPPSKHHLGPHHNNGSGIGFGFKREKSPLQISKPMLPDLGDYQVRPSIELGKATPIAPTIAVDTGLMTALPDSPEKPKANQRKTDEGWAKYFSTEKEAEKRDTTLISKRDTTLIDKRDTTLTNATNITQASAPSRSGRGGFWPGSGVPESATRSPAKNALRDSEGRNLTAHKVLTSSPNLTNGASDMRTRTMSTAEGLEAKISSGDSISTDVTDDDDYEDEHMTAYSSGVPSELDTNWTPVGNTWSGPAQRPIRPPSLQVGADMFPPPTKTSNITSGSDSTKSSLPNFPMPATNVRRIQHSAQSSVQPSMQQAQPGISFAPGTRHSNSSSLYGPPRVTSEDYFSRSIYLATTVTPQPEAPRQPPQLLQPEAPRQQPQFLQPEVPRHQNQPSELEAPYQRNQPSELEAPYPRDQMSELEAPHHQHQHQHQHQPSQPAAGPSDPSDMSWINLGTPAGESSANQPIASQPAAQQPVERAQQHPDSNMPDQ